MGESVLGGLGQAHIHSLEPLGPFLKVELDRLTLFERAEPVHLDGGVVHEDGGGWSGPPACGRVLDHLPKGTPCP